MKITVRANAKLNLTLDVVGKRDDDYHLLESVMQSVNLFDTVTVKSDFSGDISVNTGVDSIADDQTNIAWRAADAFFRATGVKNPGIDIRIRKRIPQGAGMGGGSADGAAVIVALDEMFNTRLSDDELCDIGEQVGADIPFCITGGTMIARGTGNLLTPLPDMPDCYFVIAKPEASISTAAAYRAIDRLGGSRPAIDSEDMGEEICAQDIEGIARLLGNIFEQVTDIPQIDDIKRQMLDLGALGACMTGSGSAVFGIFTDADEAECCRVRLEDTYAECFVAVPASRGCELED